MSNTVDRLGGAASALAFKAPCRMATTANITLSGYQTIDGVLPEDDPADHPDLRRVLVKNQTDASENGIYVMDTGVWERSRDFDGINDFRQGTRLYVYAGTVGSGTYIVTSAMNPETFEVGTDDITITPTGTFDAILTTLYLASGGVINFNSGDVTVTHSANTLSFAGASAGYGFDAQVYSSVAGTPARFVCATDAVTNVVLRLESDRATPANGDLARLDFYTSDSLGNQTLMALISGIGATVTDGAEVGRMAFGLASAGVATNYMRLTTAALSPETDGGTALGSTTLAWNGLHLNTATAINWENDVTITHGTDSLAFAGASSGYSFDAPVSQPVQAATSATTATALTFGGYITLTSSSTTTWSLAAPSAGRSVYIQRLSTSTATTNSVTLASGTIQTSTQSAATSIAFTGAGGLRLFGLSTAVCSAMPWSTAATNCTLS